MSFGAWDSIVTVSGLVNTVTSSGLVGASVNVSYHSWPRLGMRPGLPGMSFAVWDSIMTVLGLVTTVTSSGLVGASVTVLYHSGP